MTVKIDGTNGVDTAQLRPADGDPVAMTIAADGKVAFPQNAQTWQDMTAQRVASTIYTNDTGQPIHVAVTSNDGTTAVVTITISGLTVARNVVSSSFNCGVCGYAVVPAGATYTAAATPSIGSWLELR